MSASPVIHIPVVKVNANRSAREEDSIAIEEPLEIKLEYGPANQREVRNISVTMRTPGHDAELATGFLFTEGIIKNAGEIKSAKHSFIACAENKENTMLVTLERDILPHLQNTERNFYTTSSCGV